MARGIKSMCCSLNSFVKNLLLAPSDVTPPPADVCYVFEFDMGDITDQLEIFTYNGGAQTVPMGIDLSSGETFVKNNIEANLTDGGISFESVVVQATDIGGGLFHYEITIKNPNVIFSAAVVEGVAFLTTITNCI